MSRPLFVCHSRCGARSPGEPLPPNHHINRTKYGGWVMNCTIAPTPFTSRALSLGLGTQLQSVARIRRDALLLWLDARDVLIALRATREETLELGAEDQRWLEGACLRRFADVAHLSARRHLRSFRFLTEERKAS